MLRAISNRPRHGVAIAHLLFVAASVTLLALAVAACEEAAPAATPTPTATQFPTVTPSGTAITSFSRRTPFVPLDNPVFIPIEDATYLGNTELVLGMEWEGETRAYPVRMLTFHHIVNDTVGGRPFLVTF